MIVGSRMGQWDGHGDLDFQSYRTLRSARIAKELRDGAREEVVVAVPGGFPVSEPSTRRSNNDSGDWAVRSTRSNLGPFKCF